MSYLDSLLTRKEPLEQHEIADLKDWLREMASDCAMFGETYDDICRMTRIRARLAAQGETDDASE